MSAGETYLFVSTEGSGEPTPFHRCSDSSLAPRLLNLLREKFCNDRVRFTERWARTCGDSWMLWDDKLGGMFNAHQDALVSMLDIAETSYERLKYENDLDEGYPPGEPLRYMRAAASMEVWLSKSVGTTNNVAESGGWGDLFSDTSVRQPTTAQPVGKTTVQPVVPSAPSRDPAPASNGPAPSGLLAAIARVLGNTHDGLTGSEIYQSCAEAGFNRPPADGYYPGNKVGMLQARLDGNQPTLDKMRKFLLIALSRLTRARSHEQVPRIQIIVPQLNIALSQHDVPWHLDGSSLAPGVEPREVIGVLPGTGVPVGKPAPAVFHENRPMPTSIVEIGPDAARAIAAAVNQRRTSFDHRSDNPTESTPEGAPKGDPTGPAKLPKLKPWAKEAWQANQAGMTVTAIAATLAKKYDDESITQPRVSEQIQRAKLNFEASGLDGIAAKVLPGIESRAPGRTADPAAAEQGRRLDGKAHYLWEKDRQRAKDGED